MPRKNKSYAVQFTRATVGKDGRGKLDSELGALEAQHGRHLQQLKLDDAETYQLRDLRRVGTVWVGTFAHLRPDAPHVVNGRDVEREIPLQPDDHVVDKCHFLYRVQHNVLVWQVSRSAGGLSKLAQYLSQLREKIITLPLIVDLERINRILDGDVYELQFSYARPTIDAKVAPSWSRRHFDMVSDVHAAKAVVRLTAPRNGFLTEASKSLVRYMAGDPGYEKVKVRLTDETKLIDIVSAPLRESISVELFGRYPRPSDVYQGLEAAYDRRREQIQRQFDDEH